MSPGAPGPSSPAAWIIGLALTILGTAAYQKVFALGFVYDDRSYLLERARMLGGVSIDAIRWAFGSFHHANWQPLAVISTLIDVRLFGLDPAGHHGVNLVIHVGNAVLLFHVLRRVTGALGRPALVAALFAVHPLNVETVVWITERSNLLCFFFALLSLAAYRRYCARPGLARFAPVVGLYALSLLSKPLLVTFPFLLLLLDFWPLGRLARTPETRLHAGAARRALPRRLVRLVAEKIPLFLAAAAVAVVTYLAQRADGAVQPFEAFPFGGRVANALAAYVAYLGKALLPTDLAVIYPYRGVRIPPGEILGAAILLAAVTAFALRAWRRRPYLAVGWLWYLGLLVPVIGLVQVGHQARADRYAYVPLLGIILGLAWGLAEVVEGRRAMRRVTWAAAGMVMGAASVLTAAQVGRWRDETTLFYHAVQVTTENPIAQNNLGAALLAGGNSAAAAERFQEALRLRPVYADAQVGLGEAMVRMGRPDEGIRHLREGLRLRPDAAEIRVNLGAALAGAGRLAEAEALYREALRLRSDLSLAHMDLANLLADTARVGEALAHYAEAARLNPYDPDVRFNLGVTLAAERRYLEAATAFREALRLRPDYEEARRNLAALRDARR